MFLKWQENLVQEYREKTNYRVPKSTPLPAVDTIQGYDAYLGESIRLLAKAYGYWFRRHFSRTSSVSSTKKAT